MNSYEKRALERDGLIEGLVSMGVGRNLAEFAVKHAELEDVCKRNADAFYDGFDEAMRKIAGNVIIVNGDRGAKDIAGSLMSGGSDVGSPTAGIRQQPVSSDYDDEEEEDDDGEESLLSKLKRWGLYAGLAAGGFALGNSWPDIRSYTTKTMNDVQKSLSDRAAARRDATRPR